MSGHGRASDAALPRGRKSETWHREKPGPHYHELLQTYLTAKRQHGGK